MSNAQKLLLSGDEAIALGALHCGVQLGVGYPGTPSTEILEYFSEIGGHAQWSPNEKVALEVGIGAAFGGGRALVTMKHVGLNVAADPLFTVAYTGVSGGLVIVSADDPGMASSQNEQDNRHFAVAAGVPMLEPSDSQEAYEFTRTAFEVSERWHIPVLLRVTTRVCHSKTPVIPRPPMAPSQPHFTRDIKGRVMIPAYARPAHVRLRTKLKEIGQYHEESPLNLEIRGSTELGIISSGISYMHAREAVPQASFLKISTSYPLPLKKIAAFAKSVKRCVVVEEGDPYLVDTIRSAGVQVEGKPEMYRFGELNVVRVRRILAGDTSPEPPKPPGKPPALCDACPYRQVFQVFRKMNLIVAGDIGCYTLGVLSPFEAMDTCVCMGASVTVGLGLRKVLPPDEARRVVSVIGDSTFVHSGITGVVDMAYNRPPTGHVVVILDNYTTAMTGRQEHAGTGRLLNHEPARKLVIEDICRAAGVDRVHVVEPRVGSDEFENLLKECLDSGQTAVIVARRPCILLLKDLKKLELKKQTQTQPEAACECSCNL